MADFDRNTSLIDEYLSGAMTLEEKTAFEKLLETDEQLKQEFILQKEVYAAIESKGDHQLKEELNTYHDEFIEAGGLGGGFSPWFKKGLILLGLVGIGLVILVVTRPREGENSFFPRKQYYETDTVSTPDDKLGTTKDTLSQVVTKVISTDTTVVKVEPVNAVKSFAIPLEHYKREEEPTYTFTGQELKLFNFNHPLNEIDIRMHDNVLYLFHNNHYYELIHGAENKKLVKVKDVRAFKTLKYASGKGPKVKVTNQFTFSQEEEQQVKVNTYKDGGDQTILFDIDELILTVPESLAKKVTVRKYGTETPFFVVVMGESTYLYQGEQVQPFVDSTKFFPTAKRTLSIRHETVEDTYLNQESK